MTDSNPTPDFADSRRQAPSSIIPSEAPGDDTVASRAARGLDGFGFVMDVPVELTIEVGRRMMKIKDVLRLAPGSVLELDKQSGEPLEIFANQRLVARGEAVVVGERYGVRITEVVVGKGEEG